MAFLNFLGSILGSSIGAVATAAENEKNRKFASEQADIDRRQNYIYGERAADAADARTRALYNDLQSPEALLRQYKEAGLSPSLMFGGGGVGGQTASGAQGTGAAGLQTQYGAQAFNPIEAANVGLMLAQAEKLNAETDTIKGKNERGKAEIGLTLAQKGYTQASESYQWAKNAQVRLQNYITRSTADFDINKAHAEAERAATLAMQAQYDIIKHKTDAEVSEATIRTKIEQEKANLRSTNAETILNKALANKSEAERQKAIAEVQKWQQEVQQSWADVAVKAINAQTQREYNKIMNDWYDEQYEILQKRTSIEKTKVIGTLLLEYQSNLIDLLDAVVPL